jgi:hypothetical protein
MARLAPREDFYVNQARALISMSVVENLDVITRQDDDAPCKQPLAHTQRCYNHYGMAGLSLGSSGVQTTPRSRPRLSTGSQQARIYCTVHCHVRCQGISPSNTRLSFTTDAPLGV